jgi:hypothetical protein
MRIKTLIELCTLGFVQAPRRARATSSSSSCQMGRVWRLVEGYQGSYAWDKCSSFQQQYSTLVEGRPSACGNRQSGSSCTGWRSKYTTGIRSTPCERNAATRTSSPQVLVPVTSWTVTSCAGACCGGMYPSFLAVHHGCALCFFVLSTLLDWMTSSKLRIECPQRP